MLRETYIAMMDQVEGHKIVVTRYYPRGIARVHFDEWLSVLAPSRALLKAGKTGIITWDAFSRRFRAEILDSPEAVLTLKSVAELAESQDVYLICWEREPPCHRFLLLDMVRKRSWETQFQLIPSEAMREEELVEATLEEYL